MKYSIIGLSVLAALAGPVSTLKAQSGYHLTKTFKIASNGGWDYLAVDPGSNNLYVSHGTQVNILNKTTGDSLGVIPHTSGVHGIAFDNALGNGYTSNGRLNTVTVFDLKTFAIKDSVKTGENPDAIMYDPYSKKIITCNGRSKDLTIINPATNKVTATIPVGGKPETAVSDEAGKIYVNIEDKNEIAVVDLKSNTVVNHWSLAPGDGPTGLAIDTKTKRLFAGCDKLLVVMDATDGKIIDKLPIGDGCDGVGFDATLKYIFTSNGEGTLTVIKEVSKTEFKVLENVASMKGARTIAVDEKTHAVYMPTADFNPQAPGERRPGMKPGTFKIIVFEK